MNDRLRRSTQLFLPLDHIDCFPRAVLRTQLAPYAHFLINHHNTVYTDVPVLFRIFRPGNFIQAIDRTKLNAYLASCASFRMDDRNERRFLFLLFDGDWRCLGCLNGLLRRSGHSLSVMAANRWVLRGISYANITKLQGIVKKKSLNPLPLWRCDIQRRLELSPS